MPESKPSRREFTKSGAIAFGSFVISSCSRDEPVSRPLRPLRIAVDLWAGYFPLLIAERQGRFRERGLEIEIEIPENTGQILASFAARSFDVVAVALGDLINVAQRNPGVRIVMVSDQSDGGDQLIGATEFTGVDALRRARIGVNLGGFGELLVRAFAERAGANFDALTLVDVDAADVPSMLEAGRIDLGHTWEPYASRLVEAGYRAWFTSHDVRGLIPSCVAIQDKVIERRRRDVAALLEGWQDAQSWWREHIDEGFALAATHSSVRENEYSLHGISLVDRAENRRIFAPTDEADDVLSVTRRYVDHFASRGMLTSPLQPKDLIDPSFTESW